MPTPKKSEVSNGASSASTESSELEFLRLQVQAYQILIEEVEKELGISLKKPEKALLRDNNPQGEGSA